MALLEIDKKGRLKFYDNQRVFIEDSAIGTLLVNGVSYAPQSAKRCNECVTVTYPCGNCEFEITECESYYKLSILSVPAGASAFTFGPYETPGVACGEVVGASWYEDDALACIQSLMPKVDAGARRENGKVYLFAEVHDRSQTIHNEDSSIVFGVPGPDGHIEGAAIALLAADDRDSVLDKIGQMEIAEGLPHPTFNGRWAKKEKRATDLYLIFDSPQEGTLSFEKQLELAETAGVNCIYYSQLFSKWGHFEISESISPNGLEGLRALSRQAAEKGIHIGAHTLSNFIHTFDEYVTPVPHKDLLAGYVTKLLKPLGREDTELYVEKEKGFCTHSELKTCRIGDELITYERYDETKRCVIGCKRGAYGTMAAAHSAGDEVARLLDHDYVTFFPNIYLQSEMAHSIGEVIRDGELHRLSFDGLEGCDETGTGNYAKCEFVRQVFEMVGNELICDSSRLSNYLWHAQSYCNWGEPWYDHVRRGGGYAYRESRVEFFRRNLLPNMTGWYCLYLNTGRFEATSPENLEFMLSRSTAYDAGMALCLGDATQGHGLLQEYMEYVRLWGEFRMEADISESLREKMKDENSNWHLEKTEDGWLLTQLLLRPQDLNYGDRDVKAEGGTVRNKVSKAQSDTLLNHASLIWPDMVSRPFAGLESDPFRFRLRVGEPGCGYLSNLDFGTLRFEFEAEGGDYLVYDGVTTLRHYDKNYVLLETIEGVGEPLKGGFTRIRYTTDTDEHARYILTEIRRRAVYKIARRK